MYPEFFLATSAYFVNYPAFAKQLALKLMFNEIGVE
jgi:hypothetical protein